MNFETLYQSIIEKTAWKKHGVEFDDSVIGQLLPYVNDETCYLHFTELNKLGNNPQSKYNTPQGIYLYPLWKYWNKFLEMYPTFNIEQYKTDKNYRREFKFTDVIPFKNNSKYIIVGRLSKIRQFYDFRKDMLSVKYKYIIQKLKEYMYGLDLDNKFFETRVDYKARVDELIKDGEGDTTLKNNLGKLWNVARELGGNEEVNRYIVGNSDNTKWTYLLYNVLGIEGFVDSAGVGIIHTNEPVQAVVFSANNIETKATLLNKEQFSLKDEQVLAKAKRSKESKKMDQLFKTKSKVKKIISSSDVIQLEELSQTDKITMNYLLVDSVNHTDKKYILPKNCTKLCANFIIKNNRVGFNWDTSNVEDMDRMFNNAGELKLDVSNWDTSNVKNMFNMFASSEIKNIDVSKWNVSNVTVMSGMFQITTLMNLDVSNWNVSNVKYMDDMFSYSKLDNLDVSKWNTSNVINMSRMFDGCNVKNIDVSKWDVSNVTVISNMFEDSLANPDVSNWNVSKFKQFKYMFRNAKNAKFDVSKWMKYENISNVCKTIDILKKVLTNY